MTRRALAAIPIVSQISTTHLAILSVIAQDGNLFSFCVGLIVLTGVVFRRSSKEALLLTFGCYLRVAKFGLRVAKFCVSAAKLACYGVFWTGLTLGATFLLVGSTFDFPEMMIGGFHFLFLTLCMVPAAWLVKHGPRILWKVLRDLFSPRYMPSIPKRQEQKLPDHAELNAREVEELKSRYRGKGWQEMKKRLPPVSIQSDPELEKWLKTQTMLLADQVTPRSKDRAHTAFVGSTGGGKSTLLEIFMESILANPSDNVNVFNSFVFDPQNDLHEAIANMELDIPVILTNVLDKRAWAWDMCKDVRDPASAWQFAFGALPDEKDSSTNQFYNDAPRFIFAAVLRELVNRGIPWTLRQAFLIAMNEAYALELISTSTDPGVQMVMKLFSKEMGSTQANISASLLAKLGNLETYAALMEHAKHKFSLGQMVKSDVVMISGGDFQFNHIIQPMNYMFLTIPEAEIGRPEEEQ